MVKKKLREGVKTYERSQCPDNAVGRGGAKEIRNFKAVHVSSGEERESQGDSVRESLSVERTIH
jgi:hypothetical protein